MGAARALRVSESEVSLEAFWGDRTQLLVLRCFQALTSRRSDACSKAHVAFVAVLFGC